MPPSEDPSPALPLSSIVDLGKYPIHERGSAALAAVTEVAGRRYLVEGIVTFPGFLLPEAVELAVADIERDADKAWQGILNRPNIDRVSTVLILISKGNRRPAQHLL